MKRIFKIILLFFLLVNYTNGYAQETVNDNGEPLETDKKGFHVGLYAGAYFANQSTAIAYDGYGYDIDGNRNSFENSFMYNKIVQEYGGYGNSSQKDYIAEALGVDYHSWSFNELYMPVNMRYVPAFLFGLQCYYTVDNKNKILLNVNACKLNIYGDFIIQIPKPTNNNDPYFNPEPTFPIRGGEQRLILQLAYQRVLGDNEKINPIVEGGMNVTISKLDKNEVLINSLLIDLTSSYYSPNSYNAPYVNKRPIGTGFGAFAGLGIDLSTNAKWSAQLVYNLSYEGINIMPEARLKIQNAVGLRAYYNF